MIIVQQQTKETTLTVNLNTVYLKFSKNGFEFRIILLAVFVKIWCILSSKIVQSVGGVGLTLIIIDWIILEDENFN